MNKGAEDGFCLRREVAFALSLTGKTLLEAERIADALAVKGTATFEVALWFCYFHAAVVLYALPDDDDETIRKAVGDPLFGIRPRRKGPGRPALKDDVFVEIADIVYGLLDDHMELGFVQWGEEAALDEFVDADSRRRLYHLLRAVDSAEQACRTRFRGCRIRRPARFPRTALLRAAVDGGLSIRDAAIALGLPLRTAYRRRAQVWRSPNSDATQ